LQNGTGSEKRIADFSGEHCMKLLQFLFRAGGSLIAAFIVSFSSAVIFFNYSGYENISDRIFLVAVPTLAIGFLLFDVFPRFLAFAVLASVVFVLPCAVSYVYYLGMGAVIVVLLAFMLPAIPTVERLYPTRSVA
jgi:hypothetical protein